MRVLASVLIASFALGWAGSAPVRAAPHDGNWSVLIVTEKGDCDKGYRYNFAVVNGHVRYTGDTSAKLDGTVAANGAVRVDIRLGDQGASGTGRLSATSGSGTWRGIGPNATCAGHWEAERR